MIEIHLKPRKSQKEGTLLSSTDYSVNTSEGTVQLPILLPMKFGEDVVPEGMVKLPITLPMKFGGDTVPEGMVRLPITLPMKFSSGATGSRRKIQIPTSVTPVEGDFATSTKLPLNETASLTSARLPIRETAWNFKGIIIEENVVGMMSKPLTLIEEVRSRILADVELLNRNTVKVKWFGDEVPEVEVTKKIAVDEEYESVGIYKWSDGEAVFEIDNNEYHIKLIGVRGTGESSAIEIGEATNIDIETQLNILLNEKTYNIRIDNPSQYKIYVNY